MCVSVISVVCCSSLYGSFCSSVFSWGNNEKKEIWLHAVLLWICFLNLKVMSFYLYLDSIDTFIFYFIFT